MSLLDTHAALPDAHSARTKWLAASLLAALSACGGNGGGSPSAAPAPVATTAPGTPAPPVSTIKANLVTSVPAFTGTDTDRIAAYTDLNAARSTCGFGLLAQNANLEVSSQNHANYIGANYLAHSDAFSHIENASYLDFTGASPVDRASTNAGYGGTYIGEDSSLIATSTTTKADAMASLLTTGYHLQSLMGFNGYDMGISSSVIVAAANQSATGSSAVNIDLGSKISVYQEVGNADISTYPCAGLTIKVGPTGASAVGSESPQPLPGHDFGASPVGQPIYIHARTGQVLTITSITETTPAGVAVGQVALLTNANDPNHFVGVNEAIFFPAALASGMQYTVTIVGTNAGVAFTKTFSYNTLQ